jgi:hypothetical protein
MSTVEETSTQKDRRVVYIVITVALVLLMIIGLSFIARQSRKLPRQDAYPRTPGRFRRLTGGRRRASRLSTTYR